MIKVFFTPQVALPGEKIEYSFHGETLTASLRGETDVFDLSVLPDGELDRGGGGDEGGDEKQIETVLPVCPIVSAKRVEGVLHLELLNWIESDAPYESRFPDWVELPLPERAVKGDKPEHLAVIPWRTAQELEAAKQAQQAEAQEREDRRERIRDGLTTARTQEDLLVLVRDMAAEMGLGGG